MNEFEEQQMKLEQRKQNFRNVFLSSQSGKHVLEEILKAGGLFEPASSSRVDDAFDQGRRHLALSILKKVVDDPIKKLLE